MEEADSALPIRRETVEKSKVFGVEVCWGEPTQSGRFAIGSHLNPGGG